MHDIIRRRTIRADQLREGQLLDFEDGNPSMVSDVKHLARKVLFNARGTQFALDRDEMLQTVIIMRLVG